jgi:tRNA G10  N-methylase Trm11
MLAEVARLGYLDGVVVDPTYGRGRWWTIFKPDPLIAHDLNTLDGVDFRNLPEADESVDAVAFDPPYKLNGTPSLGDFDNAYGLDVGYVPWQKRHRLIRLGIIECARILKRGGRLLLKCQDQVCSGEIRWQTKEFTCQAELEGLRLIDRFEFLGGSRDQPMNGRTQKHAHGRPSTALVFKKGR